MQGFWRTHCFKVFGGEDWLKILLALGHCRKDVVDIANDVITRRIENKAGGRVAATHTSGPILSVRTQAAMDHQEIPDIKRPGSGIDGRGKQSRDEAKRILKVLRFAHMDLHVSSSCMHSTTWSLHKFLPQRRSSFHDTPQSLVGSESDGERHVRVFDFNIKLSRHRAEEEKWDCGQSQMPWKKWRELEARVKVLIEFASYPLHMAGNTSDAEIK